MIPTEEHVLCFLKLIIIILTFLLMYFSIDILH